MVSAIKHTPRPNEHEQKPKGIIFFFFHDKQTHFFVKWNEIYICFGHRASVCVCVCLCMQQDKRDVERTLAVSNCVKSTDLDCLRALNGYLNDPFQSYGSKIPMPILTNAFYLKKRKTIMHIVDYFHQKDQSKVFICNKIYLLIT